MKVAVGVEVITKAFVMLLLFVFKYKDSYLLNNKISGKARLHVLEKWHKNTHNQRVMSDCGFNSFN